MRQPHAWPRRLQGEAPGFAPLHRGGVDRCVAKLHRYVGGDAVAMIMKSMMTRNSGLRYDRWATAFIVIDKSSASSNGLYSVHLRVFNRFYSIHTAVNFVGAATDF